MYACIHITCTYIYIYIFMVANLLKLKQHDPPRSDTRLLAITSKTCLKSKVVGPLQAASSHDVVEPSHDPWQTYVQAQEEVKVDYIRGFSGSKAH